MDISIYKSFLGDVLIAADDIGLTGLWFVGQKYFGRVLSDKTIDKDTLILTNTRNWLDIYFRGEVPNFDIFIHFIGSSFQIEVWKTLLKIPHGKTVTYKEIANNMGTKILKQ